MSLRPAVNTDVCRFFLLFIVLFRCFGRTEWGLLLCFRCVLLLPHKLRVDLREMSERRRSAAALSSRAHAFSVEALIGSNKKRKLRGWEEKELELSMESLATDGEDPAHCLDMDPGQCAHTSKNTNTANVSFDVCTSAKCVESGVKTWLHVYGPSLTQDAHMLCSINLRNAYPLYSCLPTQLFQFITNGSVQARRSHALKSHTEL